MDNTTAPEFPSDDEPVNSNTEPDTPAEVTLPVWNVNQPEPELAELPEMTEICPPTSGKLDPADSIMSPPAPDPETPTRRLTAPARLESEEPEAMTTSPELAATAVPVSRCKLPDVPKTAAFAVYICTDPEDATPPPEEIETLPPDVPDP